MSISVTVKNNIKKRARDVEEDYANKASRYVDSIATYFQTRVKESMTTQKSGQSYIKGGEVHIASAVGEAPAVDEGILRNSISVTKLSRLVAKVFTNVEYAEPLETDMNRYFMGKRSVAYKDSVKMAKRMTRLLKAGR